MGDRNSAHGVRTSRRRFLKMAGASALAVAPWNAPALQADRARGSVNQTYVEPQVSYNFESGWYVDCDPQMTFDWTADSANGWTIPIGADVGEAFNVGSHAMSLQFGAYDLAKRPSGTPQWIIRVQLTALFPTVR